VFGKLDPQFKSIFDSFVTNGQIDVYPRVGKRGGAFCAIERPTQPTYIMLNHKDNLRDVLTLAHEAGHGINNELMKSQKYALNFGSPLCTAEVASTFMEDFVLQSLPKNKGLLMKKLDDDISTIFRQVSAYRFEQELHVTFRKKGYLAKEEIGEIFRKHMASYMGPAVRQNPGSENWWVYWSHFRSFFYVYSYASGLLISKALQNKVKQDPKFIVQVKKFLSAGASDSPKNIFKNLGVDITDKNFWLSGLSEIETTHSNVLKF
jgi:oligoendopeptidase F